MPGSADDQTSDRPLEDLFDRAVASAKDGKIRVGALIEAFGNRSFGPIMAILALIAIVPPVSGIPGVPMTIGVILMLLSIQILIGRQSPWLPKFIRRAGIGKDKVATARDKAKGVVSRIDALIGPRLGWAAGGWAQWIAALCVTLLAASLIPLDLIPFVGAVPSSAILLFGLGLTARDGLLMLLGFVVTGAAGWLIVTQFLPGGSGG